MDNEKLVKEINLNIDAVIDGISKLPYNKKIKYFNNSIEKLEESKETFHKRKKGNEF